MRPPRWLRSYCEKLFFHFINTTEWTKMINCQIFIWWKNDWIVGEINSSKKRRLFTPKIYQHFGWILAATWAMHLYPQQEEHAGGTGTQKYVWAPFPPACSSWHAAKPCLANYSAGIGTLCSTSKQLPSFSQSLINSWSNNFWGWWNNKNNQTKAKSSRLATNWRELPCKD